MNGDTFGDDRTKIVLAAAGVAVVGVVGYMMWKKKQEEDYVSDLEALAKIDRSGVPTPDVTVTNEPIPTPPPSPTPITPTVVAPSSGIIPLPTSAPYVPEANPCDALPIIQKTLCNLGAGIIGSKTVEQRVLEIAADNVKKEKFYADATIDRGVHQVPGLVSTGTHTGEGVVEYLTYKVSVPNARLWIDWRFPNGRTTSTSYDMTPYEACNQRSECFTEFGIKPCTLLDYGCMFNRGVGKY